MSANHTLCFGRKLLARCAVALGIAAGPVVAAAPKEKIMTLSWGDVIWQHEGQGAAAIDTPERMREAVRTWRGRGVTKVHFRCDDFRVLLYHQRSVVGGSRYNELAGRTTKSAWEGGGGGSHLRLQRHPGD